MNKRFILSVTLNKIYYRVKHKNTRFFSWSHLVKEGKYNHNKLEVDTFQKNTSIISKIIIEKI